MLHACMHVQVQNVMTGCIMTVAVYYSVIALVTTQINASHDTKATIW